MTQCGREKAIIVFEGKGYTLCITLRSLSKLPERIQSRIGNLCIFVFFLRVNLIKSPKL